MGEGGTGDPASKHPMVIAIDGPAGAGKSTVTRMVAEQLGMLYLDTGAMYRAATVGLLDNDVSLDDDDAVAHDVCARAIGFDEHGAVTLDGAALGERIREPEVTAEIWRVADEPRCRSHLVGLQREIIAGRDAVVEGRDATTVICPDAPLKIYLDASAEERARRRLRDWTRAGNAPSFDDVVAAVRERDDRDRARVIGGLRQAEDAVPIDTDRLDPLAVVACIIALALQRRPLLAEARVADQLVVGRSREPGYVRVAEGSFTDPPAPWQLGLSNPCPDRLPGGTRELTRHHGGRQAGVLCQGRAVFVLAGRGERPGFPLALPMLPQTWYVIEPDSWHAVVQAPGTICAWAEASDIREQRVEMTGDQLAALRGYLSVYLPEE